MHLAGFRCAILVLSCLGLLVGAASSRAADRIPIKVIIVTGFEVGDDTGDAPGEFQLWAERDGVTQPIVILKKDHPLMHNAKGEYAIVGGNTRDKDLTASRESELVTALCLDPRFDLSKTYWIVDGIAGLDPAVGAMGSAVWAENIVNGDAMREVDDRQVPAGWPYGLFAIGTKAPNQLPGVVQETGGGWGGATPDYTMARQLNKRLAHWAYQVSKNVPLVDSPAMAAFRAKYTNYPKAQGKPAVLIGDAFGAIRYWHGESRTQWAREWDKMWTNGQGTFATTSMEAQTYGDALGHMAEEGYLDFSRVMVLRTASNYCLPPPGTTILDTVGDESLGTNAAIEAAYRVGSAVAHELLEHWDKYADHVPAAQ